MNILGNIIIAILAAVFIFRLIKFIKTPKDDAEKRENAKTNLTIAGYALTAFSVVFGGLYFWRGFLQHQYSECKGGSL